MRFPHDRVTVCRLRNAECRLRICQNRRPSRYFNPKSEIQDLRSSQSGRLAEALCLLDVSRKDIGGRLGNYIYLDALFSSSMVEQ